VILSPAAGAEFFGTALPAGWTRLEYPEGSSGGTAAVSDGWVTIQASRVLTSDPAMFAPGRTLEFSAAFAGAPYQAAGFGQAFQAPPWAAFDYGLAGTQLNANTNGTNTLNVCPGCTGTTHVYRIQWTTSGITYSIDGGQVANHAIAITSNMRPILADRDLGGQPLRVNWARLSPYASSGAFLSRILDGGSVGSWGTASWTAETPLGTSVTLSVRGGNTPTPDGSWTEFAAVSNGAAVGVTTRYLQYRAELSTSNPDLSPVLKDICVSYTDTTPPTIISRSPAQGEKDVSLNADITVSFSEPMLASTITSATFRMRAVGSSSDVPATVTYAGTTATLNPTAALGFSRQYLVTLAGSVSDANGIQLGSDATWSFSTGNAFFTDNTAADFLAGTPSAGAYVSETADGEVILAPAAGAEFFGTTPPAGWSVLQYPDTDPVGQQPSREVGQF
jgi:hypothetical protein